MSISDGSADIVVVKNSGISEGRMEGVAGEQSVVVCGRKVKLVERNDCSLGCGPAVTL